MIVLSARANHTDPQLHSQLPAHIDLKLVNEVNKRYLNGKHVTIELGCGLYVIQPVLRLHGMISTWSPPPTLDFFASPLATYNTSYPHKN